MHAQRKQSVSTIRTTAALNRQGSDPMARWELERAAHGARGEARYSREVTGNVIRYLPLPTAPVVPRPGEDGEPPAISEACFWTGVALLAIGALGVGLLQKAGLL